jgi:outer membrane protein OmpA-like peptidoglycan-associated protein
MMRGRVWLPLIVLTASLLAQVAAATDFQNERINVTPFVGWTFFDKELKEAPPKLSLDNDLYWGGRIGVRLVSPLWLDLAGGYVPTTGYDKNTGCPCEASWTHLSANLMLQSSKNRAVQPFVSLGGGISKFVPRWSADDTDGTFEAAAGVKVKISNSLGVRVEARNVMLLPKDNYSKAHINNVVAGAGLVFAFGGKEDDADLDGVPDRRDKCPDTQHGCTVDENGCPIDADGDGVCDGLDQCANTPSGATVDAKGCPTDSDGDGVYDGIDQCADTPKGCTVDARGCPTDADGDGVCDGLDKCPNTPAGCKVDASGCPVDTDGDGVCDGLDKCAATPSGTQVGPDGCPPSDVRPEVRQREMELLNTGLIRLHDIKFDTDQTTILPESRPPLEVVGEVLSKWPQLKIEIGGYCDSRGTDKYNLDLSGRRVTSVRRYLLQKFPKLESAQIVAKGYGESQPLVPNTSPENMAQNRRVEFKVLNKEILQQLKP